jgi:aryl-phospho-beta-D-glucosidase BglC (GH1 family)
MTGGAGPSGGAPPTARDAAPTPTPADDATTEAGADLTPDGSAQEDAAPQPDGGRETGTVAPSTTYDPSDFLKVDATRIKNARGELVSLYGTNLGGWLVHESWMSPLAGVPDDSHMISTLTQRFGAATAQMLIDTHQNTWVEADDFAKIAAEGLNVVRIPIYYLNVMDAAGNWKQDALGHIDFSRMDWAVNQAAQHGLYSVIDLHGVPGSQNGWDHSGLVTSTPTFFRDTNAQAIALKFWTEYAKHYVGNSFVAGYDLLNEPNAATGETLWGFYDKAIAAVRAVDPDHVIFVESPWQWSQLPSPAGRRWTNVVYSNHNYQWTNNDQITVMRGFVDGIMTDATTHFPTYNVPLLIGEFTLFGLIDSWTYGLNRFAEQGGINWTMWSFKVRTTNSTWGLYNLKTGENTDTNVPNVTTDSQATILAKWSAWKTSEHFQRNNSLCDVVKAAAQKNVNLRRPVYRAVP